MFPINGQGEKLFKDSWGRLQIFYGLKKWNNLYASVTTCPACEQQDSLTHQRQTAHGDDNRSQQFRAINITDACDQLEQGKGLSSGRECSGLQQKVREAEQITA